MSLSFEPLRVEVVGSGAVGLSLGYLLTTLGHSVIHRSMRQSSAIEACPVRVQTAGATTRSIYRPRFAGAHAAFPPAVEILAIAPSDVLLAAVRRDSANGGVQTTQRLVVASLFITEWQGIRAKMPGALAFPLMSCEYCPRDGITVRTEGELEVLEADNGDESGEAIVEALGFRVVARVSTARFFARYLQTAAVYAVLSGIALGIVEPNAVAAELLLDVFAELHEAAIAAYPQARFDFPVPSAYAFAALSPIIVAAMSPTSSNDLFVANVRHLLRGGGRKLDNHLAAFKTIWTAGSGHCTPAQMLLRAVLARP